jgi:hypothetical protein
MRLLLPFLLVCALTACTRPEQSGRPPLGPTRDRVILTDESGQRYRSTESAGPIEGEVNAAVDAVWTALPAVYEALGIPLAHLDRTSGQMGNKQIVRTGRLAGQRLSRTFDCGASMTGERADQGRITASVITQVWTRPDGRTGIATTIVSTMKPLDGTSTAPTSCATTGWLEHEIVDRVRVMVKG